MGMRVTSNVAAAAEIPADEADPQIVGWVTLGAALLGDELGCLKQKSCLVSHIRCGTIKM